jgi:hypothetical protein
MSIKLDKNPYKKGGDWHTYKVNFFAVDGENGKEIEVKMMEGEDLDLYGLMTLENAAKIHEKLGEKLKEFGNYKTEIVKNLVMKRLTKSENPVLLTTLEDEFQKQGISKTNTFAAIEQLYKRDKKIKEFVTADKRVAYELAKHP